MVQGGRTTTEQPVAMFIAVTGWLATRDLDRRSATDDEEKLKTRNIDQRAWSPMDDAARRELLARSVTDDIVYTDPASQVEGVEAFAGRVAMT